METIKSESGPGNGHALLGGNSENIDIAATGESKVDAPRPSVERIASSAHQAVDRLASSATRAAQTLGVKSDQVKDAQERMTEELRVYVRDNPMTAVGLGIAAGFLLSRLINL